MEAWLDALIADALASGETTRRPEPLFGHGWPAKHTRTRPQPELAAGFGYGCLLLPHLALQVALLREPQLVGGPVGISRSSQRGALLDCSAEALAVGVQVGMSVTAAQALCPTLTILTVDPLTMERVHAELVQATHRVCPTLRSGEPGQILLDLRGLQRHYADAQGCGRDLLAAIATELGTAVGPTLAPLLRIGIAPSQFAATVAARKTPAGEVRVVALDRLQAFLDRCPVALLPLAPETRHQLDLLGLRTVGEVRQLPAAALTAQFGREGEQLWQLAHGVDPRPLVPETVREVIRECLPLPAPTAMEGALVIALRMVLLRLLNRPELRGRALLQLRLHVLLEGGQSRAQTVLLKGGSRDAERWILALRSRLTALDLDAAVVELQLEVLDDGAAPPLQPDLLVDREQQVRASARQRLRDGIMEMAQRYGHGQSPVYAIMEVDRWARLPEHRWALVPYEP